jgi:hypothetical protein
MPFDAHRPFNDLPPLPPARSLETIPVLKACIGARAALAELKAVGALIPDQAVLINSIPLLEAQASSEIENIVTTSGRLFRFAGQGQGQEAGADPATKEASAIARRWLGGSSGCRHDRSLPSPPLRSAVRSKAGTSTFAQRLGRRSSTTPPSR